jgi:hypothetical protein
MLIEKVDRFLFGARNHGRESQRTGDLSRRARSGFASDDEHLIGHGLRAPMLTEPQTWTSR